MPYFTKKGTGKDKGKTCVYKKENKTKVGCTDGPVEKYLAALHMNESEEDDFDWVDNFQWAKSMLMDIIDNCNDIMVYNYSIRKNSFYTTMGKPTTYLLSRCKSWWDKFSQIPLDDNGRGIAEWFMDYDKGEIAVLSSYELSYDNRDMTNTDIDDFRLAITERPQGIVNSLNGVRDELFVFVKDDGEPNYDLMPKEYREGVKQDWENLSNEIMNESEENDFDWVRDMEELPIPGTAWVMEINPEDSEEVQHKLFDAGFGWSFGGKQIQRTPGIVAFVSYGGWDISDKNFKWVPNDSYNLDYIIRRTQPNDLFIYEYKDGVSKLKNTNLNESDDFDWIRDVEADMLIPGEIYDIKTGNGYYWVPEKFIGKEWDNEYNQEVYRFKDLNGSGSGMKSTQYVKDLLKNREIRVYDPNWSVRDEIRFSDNIEDALNGSFVIYFKDGVYLDQTKELQDRLFDMGFSFYTKELGEYITNEDSPNRIQFFESVNWDTSKQRYQYMPPDQWDNKKVMLVSVDEDGLSRWSRRDEDKRLEDQKLFQNIVDNDALVINGDRYVNNGLNESEDGLDWIRDINLTPIDKIEGTYEAEYDIVLDYFKGRDTKNYRGWKYESDYRGGYIEWWHPNYDGESFFATPFWDGQPGLPIDSDGESKLIDIPEFNYKEDLIDWLENKYEKIVFDVIQSMLIEMGYDLSQLNESEEDDFEWIKGINVSPNYQGHPQGVVYLKSHDEIKEFFKLLGTYGVVGKNGSSVTKTMEDFHTTLDDISDEMRDSSISASFFISASNPDKYETGYWDYGVDKLSVEDWLVNDGCEEVVDCENWDLYTDISQIRPFFVNNLNESEEDDFDWIKDIPGTKEYGQDYRFFDMYVCGDNQYDEETGEDECLDGGSYFLKIPKHEVEEIWDLSVGDMGGPIDEGSGVIEWGVENGKFDPYEFSFVEYVMEISQEEYCRATGNYREEDKQLCKGYIKESINEVAGISFESRKWAEIINNEIKNNPQERQRLIIDGYDYPEAFDSFPIDYVIIDFYDRLTGYGQEHSGYDKDGNYIVLLYIQPQLVDGKTNYDLQSALNHEMKHAWEDYNRLSKGLKSVDNTKESQELYNRDFILMLSDKNVTGPIKEILKYYYYLSKLEKSAYLENVYDGNPQYEMVVREIAGKDFELFKDRFDLDVNWHLMNVAYDIPFIKKFKSARDFIDYSAKELRSKALEMIKKINKMKYIHKKNR